MTKESDGEAQAGAPPAEAQKTKRLLHYPVVMIASGVLLFFLVALAGTLWWLHARHYESTDDAFVDTHLVHLAPQIMGQVIAVTVDDNQLVQVGHPLVVIDSADTQSRVAQARAQRAQALAQLANAQAQLLVNEASDRQSQADATAAQAQASIAALDLARYESLAT